MVCILTDSTSCLSPATGRQKEVVVVPHLVDFSGQVYREWVDIDAAAFIAKLAVSNDIPNRSPTGENLCNGHYF